MGFGILMTNNLGSNKIYEQIAVVKYKWIFVGIIKGNESPQSLFKSKASNSGK